MRVAAEMVEAHRQSLHDEAGSSLSIEGNVARGEEFGHQRLERSARHRGNDRLDLGEQRPAERGEIAHAGTPSRVSTPRARKISVISCEMAMNSGRLRPSR